MRRGAYGQLFSAVVHGFLGLAFYATFQAMNSDRQAGPPAVWVLADDRAGNRSQCLGVADALGLEYQIKDIAYSPWAVLPNAVLGASFAGLSANSRTQLTPPWPDVVIAAGRRTAPVARQIGRLGGSGCALIQIMHPGAGVREFTLIARPNHDQPFVAGNILAITGAPHRLTPGRLKQESDTWQGRFDGLPKPWVALIVGGSTRRKRFTPAMARELGARASKMALLAGGSLLVSTSRRTGAATETLIDAITAPRRIFRWDTDAEQDNPYYGYLALADAVIVTGDSVSMCTEACAGTGPVYIYAPPALSVAKHARLHEELYQLGYARPLAGDVEPWSHPPLNPALAVAAEIKKRLGV
ncbi:MAG: mitochondrial fission ELM1 family protein [Proteobacteria bacterium]|nr:mitochondrial fission ELM1 family protein [Pseudomonadota bacterium]